MGLVPQILKDKNGNVDMTDFGGVSLFDASAWVGFSTAVTVIFTSGAVLIPTGEASTLALSDVFATLAGVSLSYAMAVALGLFAVQLVQSAQSVGRNDNIDIKDYVDRIGTGATIAVGGTLVAHLGVLFEISAITSIWAENFVTQVGVVVLSTLAFLILTRYN